MTVTPKIYIDRPPEYQVVEVTRENFLEVGSWLPFATTSAKYEGVVVVEVTYHFHSETEDIKLPFPEPVHSPKIRNYYLRVDEERNVKLLRSHEFPSQYIEISQDGTVIDG